jgi:hypothetical protein
MSKPPAVSAVMGAVQRMRIICYGALLYCALGSVASASMSIPTGASLQLNGGTLSLGESALNLGGTLGVGSGQLVGLTDLTTLPGSALSAASGLIELSGNWTVPGTFNAGMGAVNFIDGSSGVSSIHGSNAFFVLSLVSAAGKHIVLDPGGIQQITQQLEIQGTAAQPIQIERLPDGDIGQMNLLAGGIQLISHVGVSNVYATGQPLAPDLTNEGGSGNAYGWFGTLPPPPVPIPASSPLSLLTLFGLILVAVFSFNRRNPFAKNRGY